jgi:hypothetical protein
VALRVVVALSEMWTCFMSLNSTQICRTHTTSHVFSCVACNLGGGTLEKINKMKFFKFQGIPHNYANNYSHIL